MATRVLAIVSTGDTTLTLKRPRDPLITLKTRGMRGDTGAVGPAPTLTSGVITTLTVGSPATASLTPGVPGAYALNLGLPVGATGTAGSKFYWSAGVPAGGTGVIGDWHTNTATWDVSEKTGAAAWTVRGNIKGAIGNTGPAPTFNSAVTVSTLAAGASATASITGTNPYTLVLGIPAGVSGGRWFSGSGAPSGALGIVGDWYLNTGVVLGDVYEKTAVSTWTLRTNIRGAAGAGTGDVVGPAGSIVDNFVSFDTTTGKSVADSGFNALSFLKMIRTTGTTSATDKVFQDVFNITGTAIGMGSTLVLKTSIIYGSTMARLKIVGWDYTPSGIVDIDIFFYAYRAASVSSLPVHSWHSNGSVPVTSIAAYEDATNKLALVITFGQTFDYPHIQVSTLELGYTGATDAMAVGWTGAFNTDLTGLTVLATPASGLLTSKSHSHVIANLPTGTTGTTVALGNHLHTGVYEPVIAAGTAAQYRRGDNTWQTLDKTAVGLSLINNVAQVEIAGTQTITGGKTFSLSTAFNAGGQGVSIGAGASDHAYLSFFARTATPAVRTAFIGFGSSASTVLSVTNEIAAGVLALGTTGNGNVNISAGTGTVNVTAATAIFSGDVSIGASKAFVGSNTGQGAPTFTTRSAGAKLILFSAIDASNTEYAIGIEASAMWSAVATTGNSFKWYGGTTLAATLTGAGALTAASFSGVGTALTALNASNLGSGTVPDARLPLRLAQFVNATVGAVASPDSVTETGWNYWTTASAIGMADAMLFTIAYGSSFMSQTAYSLNVSDLNETWRRTKSSATWTAWTQVIDTTAGDARYARITLGGAEKTAAASGTSGTVTLDCAVANWFTLTPTAAVTAVTLTNPPASGTLCTINLEVSQGATAYAIATPTGGIFIGAVTPTQVINKKCIFTYVTRDGGTTWICSGGVQV